MRARRFLLPIAALVLVGCDRITGADQQKALDAEAIGYSCRISLKPPEDCMKENDTHSPTSILYGWKEADKDVQAKNIDPSMGKNQPAPQIQPSATPAVTENKPAPEKAAETAARPKSDKSAATKNEKPAAATTEPDKDATETKAVR